jgi:transcriptional regulator GlxA family with amidase domain
VASSLLSPTMPTQIVWRDDCAQLILLMERRVVEQRAAALTGTSVKPVEFEPSVDLTTSVGEPLELEQLAKIAGTGIRALQLGFRRHFGTSVSAMLQDIRPARQGLVRFPSSS